MPECLHQRLGLPHAADGQRLIDAHHHLWNLDTHRYPWLQDEVDPGLVDVGEQDPAVDHQQAAAELEQRHVAADGTEPAQRRDPQPGGGQRRRPVEAEALDACADQLLRVRRVGGLEVFERVARVRGEHVHEERGHEKSEDGGDDAPHDKAEHGSDSSDHSENARLVAARSRDGHGMAVIAGTEVPAITAGV